jgi:hypothetical protein
VPGLQRVPVVVERTETMRKWAKYINKNKTCGDCQLVTALNAYYYLTGEQWCKQDSAEYERFIDLSGCRAGSAINIDRVYQELGIEIIWSGINLLDLMVGTKIILPVEWSTWSWEYGFHSTLIVNQKGYNIRVTNFSKIAPNGWMPERSAHLYENFSMERDHRLFRLFGIKGDPWNQIIKKMWKREEKRWFTMMRDLYENRLKTL